MWDHVSQTVLCELRVLLYSDKMFKCMRVVIYTVDNCSCTPPPTTNTHTKQQYLPDEPALHLEEEEKDHGFFHTVSPHIIVAECLSVKQLIVQCRHFALLCWSSSFAHFSYCSPIASMCVWCKATPCVASTRPLHGKHFWLVVHTS